jgi:hypothetical protein
MKIPLCTNMFDGEIAAGPIPILFSEDTRASLEGLNTNAQKAHQDIQHLEKVFFMPEYIDVEEAINLVKKPR